MTHRTGQHPTAGSSGRPEDRDAAERAGHARTSPSAATGTVLDVEDARVSLGGRAVLHGVDVHVAPGEMVALLGANGSGKSTLVRAVVGLVPLSGGDVRLFGTPLARFRGWGRVGYVPQRVTAASGVPASVREVVEAGRLAGQGLLPWRHRRQNRAAVTDALDRVGLADRAREPVHALSGGQQQRVLIARALVGRPELLLLDEPMAGVDLPSQETFAAALAALRSSGTSVLLVAHELGPLETQVDRAVVLRHGRVAYEGTPPPALGHHAAPGHDHVHPHTGEPPDETGWLR